MTVFAEEVLPDGVLALAGVPAQTARSSGRMKVSSPIDFMKRPCFKINHMAVTTAVTHVTQANSQIFMDRNRSMGGYFKPADRPDLP